MDQSNLPRLTYKVHLAGGQDRLREAALYVMEKCKDQDWFGLTKLNKILWRADFEAYAARRSPVTGRMYQRLAQGPAPVEMLPILDEMLSGGLMRIDIIPLGRFEEKRPVALASASLRYFSKDDLAYLDQAIEFYCTYTGRDVSEHSHGVAWKTRRDGDPMPYELALLSDDELSSDEQNKFAKLGLEHGWHSE